MVQFLGYIIGEEGIQIDQGKVTAVTEWSTHQFVKELQRFLGFANFYRSFIKGFSLLTALLTTLLRGEPKSLSWSSSTHEAFKSLRTAFSKAHLSVHLPNGNPFWAQFTMHRALDIQAANGTSRSSKLLRYWWPSMSCDIIRYIRSCSVCVMSSTPRHLQVGKLIPLPIPRRPWSHMGIYFVTDLPDSVGNTCIRVAVDHVQRRAN